MKRKKPRDFTRLTQEDEAIKGGIANENIISIIVILVKICVILWSVVPAATAQLASSPWPMFHHDLNHTGLSPYYGPNTATVKWTFYTGGGRGIFSSATIAPDETIYIGTSGWHWFTRSRLYAINPDGTEKWHWSPPLYSYHGLVDFIDSTPAVASDGTIYIGCWNRCLYALYPNGTEKWEFYDSKWKKSRGFVLTSPAIAPDGTIYVGNNNGKPVSYTHLTLPTKRIV